MLQLVALNLLAVSLAHAGTVCFSDAQNLRCIDTDSNAVTAALPQQGVVALTLDQKNSTLWALTAGRLYQYGAGGSTLLNLDLKTLATNFNAAKSLALDPSDDSIWVAGGNNLFHLDANGHALAGVTTPATVQDIALAQDETLWVLGVNQLLHYSAQGSLLGSASLTGGMQQANFLALDDANGVLWLGGAKQLYQVALALPLQTKLSLSLPEVINGVALASDSGTLWAVGQSSLFAFGKDGSAAGQTSFPVQALGNPQVLVYNAPSQSLWLGHEKGISRFTAGGQYVGTLPASVKVGAISTAPSGIVPLLTLVSPASGALSNNPVLPLVFHYDASCFGQPCNYPASSYASDVLTATLNGQAIGNAVQFDPATGNATYTPTSRYPEGASMLNAYLTDSGGRRSKPLSSQFTIDTIAPKFLNVTPADGTVFLSPGMTLAGSIDDPLGKVTLDNYNGATVSGPNPAGQNFSYAITLRPGTNSFRLGATDPAGNATLLPLHFIYSTLTLSVASPADGATVNTNTVTVSGTFSGDANPTITVNGVAATISGNNFTAAGIPLQPGSNTITVSGVSSLGAKATQTITVNCVAPAVTITAPAPGATINGNSVLVSGVMQGPANSGVVVNGVVAAVANGAFSALVPLTAGANVITANLSTPTGGAASQSVTVNASGQAPAVYATADPVSGFGPLTVTFTITNPTASDASFTFSAFGPYPSPASSVSTLSVTYPIGVYTPAITVTDASGNVTTQSFVIESVDQSALDQQLRAIWTAMNNALLAGDKATAMQYLNTTAKAKYGAVFDALLPSMPKIVASYSALQSVSLSPNIGEYAVNRMIDGVNRIYLIYFLRDFDGVWRVDAM